MRPELHFPTFRAVACALVATILSGAARATESRADKPGALTNWQAAYSCFRTAGTFIANKEFQRARTQLSTCATNLATPYNQLAQQFLIRLEAALNRPSGDEDGRLEGLTDLCMKLHAYPAAAQLTAAARTGSTPGEERKDELRAWCLFENGKIAEATAEYERKMAETSISTWQSYYKKQIELVQGRATNLTNVPFALEFVREHYLKGFEGKADLFCALNELNRVLAYAKEAKDGLLVYRSIIQCLSSLNDDAGRDAWEDKLLRDLKADQDACAEVYVNRGIRAFLLNDFPQALVFFRKVCREYPNSEFYGDAQYNIGSTLQAQKKYDEAIEEYAKLFTSNVDEYKLVPGTSEDYKLYRHKAALRTSECYESKQDYAHALHYAELAINQYKPLSWCSTCLKTAREALEKRINKLQDLLAHGK